MRRQRLLLVTGVLVLVVGAVLGITFATAADPVNHGITFTKGCTSPTQIGAPYSCTYSVRNIVDDAEDTLTIDGLVDTVQAAGGNVSSGNAFSSLKLNVGTFLPGFSTPPSCPGATGTGTVADPWRAPGLTTCILPFGSRLNVQSFSFYTVVAADFNLPAHKLTDSAAISWHDLCNDPLLTGNSNCNPDPPNSGAASQTTVTQLPSTTTTQIHNAAHSVVTVVPAGTTVHDRVVVSGGPGNPPPTGTVTIDWFTNNTCTTPAAATSAPITLGPGGVVDATGFPQGPLAPGLYGFKAHYAGDPANPTYVPSDGACEPLRVVDANIQIAPSATNRVGSPHVFTGHVNVNDGTGFVNAPDGTSISFTINSGPGSFSTPNPCVTAGGTGSCTITLNSAVTGVTSVSANTTLTVGGLSVSRATNGVGANSGPAAKTWVDAKISITPSATN
jgi:hypothetical protein